MENVFCVIHLLSDHGVCAHNLLCFLSSSLRNIEKNINLTMNEVHALKSQ